MDLLFTAPAHGLPSMPSPSDDHVRDLIRMPPHNLPRGVRAHKHICIGPRLLNGFINNKSLEPDEDLWECLSGCENDPLAVRSGPSSQVCQASKPFAILLTSDLPSLHTILPQ
jgi:hypothetical protein